MSIGIWQLILILVVVLLIFGGGGRISKIMGDVGKGVRNLKDGLQPDNTVSKNNTKKVVKISDRSEHKKKSKKS